MIIQVSTEVLKKFGISANDYLYLYLIDKKEYDILKELNLDVDLESLQTKNLLKIGEDVKSHIIRGELFTFQATPFDQMWGELLSYFPLKVSVSNGKGVRVLRAKDPTALANKQAKKKYQSYINGDVGKHKEVIKCLKTELSIRSKGDTMGYMQMLPTWVNQHTWEKYESLDGEQDSQNSRITRQL
jgi:hypothetical protein